MPYNIQVTVAAGLNYRTKPSTKRGTIKGAYPKGTKLLCSEKTSENGETWYKVQSNGYWVCGYMPKDGWYIKSLSTSTSKPTDTTTKPPASPNTSKPTSNNDSVIKKLLEEENSQFEFSGGGTAIGLPSNSKGSNNATGFGQIGTSAADTTYDYKIDTSWLREYLNIVKKNANIYIEGDENIINSFFTKFNRFDIDYPDLVLDKTFAFVFMTRPDLNILNGSSKSAPLHPQVQNDPTCYYINNTRPEIITSLTKNHSSSHDFNVFLCNHASSFEVSDEFIKTGEMGETLTGHKIAYGKNNIESKTAGSFNIQYTDDKELNIYKMHKLWTDYISKVYRGEWKPKREYITDKVLDYATSVYYILCAGDGETILFWSKYYGVFPTNTPSSTLSWSKGNSIKNPEYSITYQYSFKEDFNPLALAEFNMNCKDGSFVYKNIYEPILASTGRSFSGAPFIDTVNVNGEYRYKLRFRKES